MDSDNFALHPMTLEEINEAWRRNDEEFDVIGYSCYAEHRDFGLACVVIDYEFDHMIGIFGVNPEGFLHEDDYGTAWRCWPSMPTKEDMSRCPWPETTASEKNLPYFCQRENVEKAIERYTSFAEDGEDCNDMSDFARLALYAIKYCQREGVL